MPLLRRPTIALVALLLALPAAPLLGDSVPQTLPFAQSWTNTGLITINDIWTGVPGIEGFRGDGLTGGTGVDPQTVLAADDPGVLDVNANQANPNTFTTGGVTEFHITDPVVALQGSGTARAPYLRFYLNTTGATGIRVYYRLRDIDGSSDNAVQQVALHYRVGSTGDFANIPAAYVADATTGGSATQETIVCVTLPAAAENQPLVQLRVMTTDAAGSDEWVGIDDIAVDTQPCPVFVSVADTSVLEGDSGTTSAGFLVQLSRPADAGGVTFDVTTQDGTATVADGDYDALAATGVTIPEGESQLLVQVTVHGDTDPEPDETFQLLVSNVTGAVLTDGVATGTIQNDDFTLTAIHDVQGGGAASPLVGQTVTVRGLVTGLRSNGFFLQTPDGLDDADPATSEGILVFTGSAPTVAVGDDAAVTGTVIEFVPAADPQQPPLTELGAPLSILVFSSGNPLPAPVPLTLGTPDPAGAFDQLERLEGMRVSVAALEVVGPTLGNLAETTGVTSSTGVFYGVVPGHGRPLREAGVQLPDDLATLLAPQVPPANIPRFDTNPERIRVDSDAQPGTTALDARAGQIVTGLIGPLDYSFRTYTILPDAGAVVQATGSVDPAPAAPPTFGEITVAAYNFERLFDDFDDPGIGEPVVQTAYYQSRLDKASLHVRDYLHAPDILGAVEVEKLAVLEDLAARISADAIASAQPDPLYQAHLFEGNDVGGIDVGFLVKTAPVNGPTPRIEVIGVVQEGLTTTWIDPSDGQPDLLNDRPPLRLEAIVHHPNGSEYALTVIVVHQRSLNGITSVEPNGATTTGNRVRQKRRAQAEYLADLVQARQVADPTARIVVVGDFNGFEDNDGLVDVMGTVMGTPAPADEVVLASPDLVNPDLVRLVDADDYSFVFDGNAQNLDHALVNAALVASTSTRRLDHARVNADFPETDRALPNARMADHDPLVVYLEVGEFADPDALFRDGFESGNTARWSFTETGL